VIIDRLRAGDGERLRAIRLRALRDAPDAFATTYEEAAAVGPENWNRQPEQLATFVATERGTDLGLVRGALPNHPEGAAYLVCMWVAPEARRQGIGSALVDAIVQWARAQGVTRLLLDVSEVNEPAIAFYTRKGFVPTGEVGALPPPREHIREIQMGMSL
jgi:ribosomal protein S18 acetylase RimI-like enzyme